MTHTPSFTQALASYDHCTRKYRRARRLMTQWGLILQNSWSNGAPVATATTPSGAYLFEASWDEAEAQWVEAQSRAIGWASRP